MKAQLVSLPDARVHPPLTVGKVYEVRRFLGNGSIILSDDMKTLVLVLAHRLRHIKVTP